MIDLQKIIAEQQEHISKLEAKLYDVQHVEKNFQTTVDNMRKELRAEKAAIRQAYNQYQFFMEGYRNGSASIAEVTAAHNEFIALLS